MSTLRELQRQLRAALLDGHEHAAVARIQPDEPGPAARLAVYRHHVVTSLAAALESTYPVVVRLVDPRFFRYAADRYIREHPPTGPCLFEYGGYLGDFLERFEPTRHLAYLPDVARLEWAMNVASHADDAAPISPEALRCGAEVALHPCVTLLSSPWPVDAIWRANQAQTTDQTVNLDSGGARLQIWRDDEDDIVFRRLGAEAFAFVESLRGGGGLEAAVEAALSADVAADLAALVRMLLDDGILIAAAHR